MSEVREAVGEFNSFWTATTHSSIDRVSPTNLTSGSGIYTIVWMGNRWDAVPYDPNSEVKVSGLEARFYIRGGLSREPLDPAPILRPRAWPCETWYLTPKNRRRVAIAAMQGWIDGHPDQPSPVFAYHRHMAGVGIQIGAGS